MKLIFTNKIGGKYAWLILQFLSFKKKGFFFPPTSCKTQGKIYLVYYLIGLPELKTTGGKANKINMQRSSALGTHNFLANGFTLRMKQHKTIPISFFFCK